MNVFEYAMQMEKDGEAYYRSAVARVEHKGIRSILTMLADAEVLHYRLFETMRFNQKAELDDSRLLKGVRNIFQEMAAAKGNELVSLGEIDLYRKAQEIEQETMDFYLAKGNEALDSDQHSLFLKVAEEEKKHYMILENLISFVARPEQWLENPEWYHLEDY